MSNRILKFALSALLLTASASAFADDGDAGTTTEPAVVTLSNGTSVTWSHFTQAINGDIPNLGNIENLPATNKASIDLKDAQNAKLTTGEALTAANTALGKAQDAKTKANNKLEAINADDSDYNTAISDADDELTTAQNTEKEVKAEYTEAKIAELKEAADASQKSYDDQVETIDGWRTQLSTAKTNLATANGYLAKAIAEAGIGTATWLNTIYNTANNFLTNYNQYEQYSDGEISEYTDNGYRIYYTLTGTSLRLAFDATNGAGMTGPTTPKDFYNFINTTTSSIKYVYVVLGSKYVDEDGKLINGGVLTVPGYGRDKYTAVSYAVNAISGIRQDYTEPKETADVIKYRGQVAQYERERDDLEDNINYWTVPVKEDETDDEEQVGITRLQKLLNDANADQKAYDDATTAVSNAEAEVAAKQKALDAAQKEKDDAVEQANSELSDANDALDLAQQNYNKAKRDDDTAQLKVNAATEAAQAAANSIALIPYGEVTLTSDVTVSTPIKSFSGTINGNDNIITVESGVLFTTFNGTLSEVAINGKTFTNRGNSATFTNVARWDAKLPTERGVFYGDGSSKIYETLGELGFAARAKFGVSFAGNALVDKAAETTVYKITRYDITKSGADKSLAPQYVTVDATNKIFVTLSGTTLSTISYPKNTFFKSQTPDLTGIANIFYEDNTCDNVEIVESANFYCPVALEAKKVSYNRSLEGLSSGYAYKALCLPFAFSADQMKTMNNGILSVCTFEKIDENVAKFWFMKKTDFDANTPVLFVLDKNAKVNGFNLTATDDQPIMIGKTETQVVLDEGDNSDEAVSYGTLKSVTAQQINGASNLSIFGVNKNNEFQLANDDANFAPFRMVIGTKKPVIGQKAPARAPQSFDTYCIGILDEEGNEIFNDPTSGIENVATDAASLNVTTAQGQIIIESDADYGKVEIYSVDGRLAAVANVTVGTTTVDVNAGVYIVMGKKVLVK